MKLDYIHPHAELRMFRDGIGYVPGDVLEARFGIAGDFHSHWFFASELIEQIPLFVRKNATGHNVYLGVNPRRAHGLRCDENVVVARVVFADFDKTALADALSTVAAAGLPLPTLVLVSGNGVHVYWRLAAPVLNLAKWKLLQMALARKLGSDPKVCNPERIMRLPGFLNLKRRPGCPAYVANLDADAVYDVGVFATLIPPAPVQPVVQTTTDRGSAFGANPDRWLRKAVERARGDGRNNAGLWLAAQLRDDGLNQRDTEIWLRNYVDRVRSVDGHPYTETEAMATVRQAFKRPARGRAVSDGRRTGGKR